MKINLRGDFSPEFMQKIPALEQEMMAHELSPSAFTIEKMASPVQPMAIKNPAIDVGAYDILSYEYTVHIYKDAFTVTMSGDMQFLEYFYGICFSPGDGKISATEKLINIIERLGKSFGNWLTEDPLKKK